MIKHLYLATPTYNQTVSLGFVQSVQMTMVACGAARIVLSGPDFRGGPYGVDVNRNWLVHRFLNSPADAILFLDDDITWDEKAVVSLCQSGLEFCGGAYPKKEALENFPIKLVENGESRIANGKTYREAQYLPGGFMLIHRSVFEQLKPVVTSYLDDDFLGERMHVYFQNIFSDQGFCGEDVSICVRYRNLGGKVWIDPDIEFEHMGPKVWSGNYARHLEKQPPAPIAVKWDSAA